jgi:hypothetical protein
MLKPDETRGWWTGYAGPLVIHAAKHKTLAGRDYNPELTLNLGLDWFDSLPYGSLIGVVDMGPAWLALHLAGTRDPEQRMWGDYRSRGDDGKRRYAFPFACQRLFSTPVPWGGRQGFFEVPGEIIVQALARKEGPCQ